MAIPQKLDLTDTWVTACDFSRKTNVADDHHRQLAVLGCVMFNTDEKLGIEESGCNPGSEDSAGAVEDCLFSLATAELTL